MAGPSNAGVEIVPNFTRSDFGVAASQALSLVVVASDQ
jgi:hypothetical protein